MDHQVAAAAPDGDEVALHSRAHETNQSIRSGGQFGQVCDVVVVPAILGSEEGEAGRATDGKNAPEISSQMGVVFRATQQVPRFSH